MNKTIWIAAAVALSLPFAAEAQQQATDVGGGARIDAALTAAVEAGIPVELLHSKVSEGRAKGIPLERIAVAVETRLDALVTARTVMERARLQSTTAGDLSIAADAVQMGVSESALVEITRQAPHERRALAVAVLANLVALGHGSEHALTQVSAALNRGAGALVNLQARTASELQARGAVGVDVGRGTAVDAGVRIDLGRRPGGGS
ncbi:hypothetical protein BH23GEM9_BH23GEM9_00130 [soil metagenome]